MKLQKRCQAIRFGVGTAGLRLRLRQCAPMAVGIGREGKRWMAREQLCAEARHQAAAAPPAAVIDALARHKLEVVVMLRPGNDGSAEDWHLFFHRWTLTPVCAPELPCAAQPVWSPRRRCGVVPVGNLGPEILVMQSAQNWYRRARSRSPSRAL